MTQSSTVAPRLLVQLSADELAELVRGAVTAALAAQPPTIAPRPTELMTVAECADMLRASERHVRRLLACGRLRGRRIVRGGSSRVLVARADLEQLLQESST